MKKLIINRNDNIEIILLCAGEQWVKEILCEIFIVQKNATFSIVARFFIEYN